MKVLQSGMTATHGGVESFVLNYARILKQHGITFDYIDLQGRGLAESEWIRSEGSKIYTLLDYRKHPFLTVKQIRAIIKKEKYDCIHINLLSAASLVTVIGGLLGGTKVLVHSHNSQTPGIPRKVLHSVNSIILRYLPVRRLACGTKAGNWMYGKKPYEVVQNAIDTEVYRFCMESRRLLRLQLHIAEDTVVLGFVGRICTQKNPLYLLKILNAVMQRGLKNVKMLIVGTGDLQQKFLDEAAAMGIEDYILYAGSQKNIGEWFSAMDALLLPSMWEGLPLVGVEAQAAGLPCFFSNQITEEIALTELAHFCELTETAGNWADSILSCMQNLSDRHTYADVIGATAYSIIRSAEHLRNIYDSLVSDNEVNPK